MIEHFPDLIAFFKSASTILKENGILSLVVPDKRFCFDYFQPLHLTGDVLEAHALQRTRHSRKTAFNTTAYMVRSGGQIAWGQRATDTITFYTRPNLRLAHNQFIDQRDDPAAPYADFHGWYFTPSSFRLICLELAQLGLIEFEEASFFATMGCEFFVALRRAPLPTLEHLDEIRMDYLRKILLEFREQTDFLIEGRNYVGPVLA